MARTGRNERRWRRRARRLFCGELLEARLALSGQNPIEASGASWTDSLSSGPLAPHAEAVMTTSAPIDQFASIADPAPLSAVDSPAAALATAGELIGLPSFKSDPRFVGIDGSGYSVVIIDTGADLDHPFFGPDANGDGVADRIVYSANFASDGVSASDLNGHGTHVSSIVASQDAAYPGIASGVNIIELRVLDASGFGSAASIESALQWVATHVESYNIVAVNMSLSFGDNSGVAMTRPELGISDELAAIAAQDVIVSSASGNAFFTYNGVPGVSYPSSDPNSLSIGAVWDGDFGAMEWGSGARDNSSGPDRITSFSQRHPTLTTVFAPGAAITAAAIGGGVTTMSGTSMAAPIVTGAAALMQDLALRTTGHRLSLAQFAEWVSDTGIPIFDGDDEDDNVPNTEQTYHRIDLVALADAVMSGGLSNLTIPSGLQLDSPTATAGGLVRADFTIANQGGAVTGSFTSGIYLSSDQHIDASDTLLAEVSDQLAAGGSVARSQLALQIPADLAPGVYYVGVVGDDHGAVAEGNEGNNTAVSQLIVTASGSKLVVKDAATNARLASGVSTLDFGDVIQGNPDITKTFTIDNDGGEELVLSGLILPAGFTASGFPEQISPRESASFTISLSAASTPASYSGIVAFASNDPQQTSFSMIASGDVLEADDHGNDALHATEVAVNADIQGKILRLGDVDWFRFEALAGVTYHFSTTLGTLSDSVLRLIDVNGTSVLAVNDDGPAAPASQIDWTAPADGFYFLEVSGAGQEQGTYTVSLLAEDDHGNTSGVATLVTDPSVTAGAIESIGDRDWFSFQATAGVMYHFQAVGTSLASTSLSLVDRDGMTVLSTSDSGGASASLDFSPDVDGVYYAVVEAATPQSIGAYRLVINGADDYGDNLANAFALTLPTTINGVINDAEDQDWFRFDTVLGVRYQFNLVGPNTPVLRLVGPDGLQISAEEASVPGAAIDWVAPAAGTFYLEVSDGAGGVGGFQLSGATVDDHGNDALTATPISDPSDTAGVIETANDVDWFSFQAVGGDPYHLDVTLGALSAATLRIISVDGASELASSSGAPALDWTAQADGLYYVEVSAPAAALLGDYNLQIKGVDDHGNDPQNATPLSIPGSTPGVIDRTGDVDWFVLTTLPGVEYRLEVTLQTLNGAMLHLFGPDGQTEIGSAVAADGVAGAINWNSGAGGNFYLEVGEVQFSEGTSANEEAAIAAGGSYRVTANAVSRLPGDYDGDQDIDGNDFLVWQRTQGMNGLPGEAVLDAKGFEPFHDGALSPQFGWQQLGSPAGAATVQSATAASGIQSVRIDRAAGADNWWGVPLGVEAPTGPFVFVSWDMRVTATGAVSGALGPFMGVQAYDDAGGFGLLGSLGVDATTMDLVYQRQGDGVIVEAGRKLSSDTWYNFGLLFDFNAHTFTIYFEQQPLATNELVDLHATGANLDRLTDADFVALAAQPNSASQLLTATAFADNFSIVSGDSPEFFPADGNRDGLVNGLDLAVWRGQFGVDYQIASAGSETANALVAMATPAPLSVATTSTDNPTLHHDDALRTPPQLPLALQGLNRADVSWRLADVPARRPAASSRQAHDDALTDWPALSPAVSSLSPADARLSSAATESADEAKAPRWLDAALGQSLEWRLSKLELRH